MRIPTILIIAWKIIIVCCSPDNYCTICSNRNHIMCKYKKGPSTACFNYKSSEINADAKASIIGLHNKFRSKVAQGLERRGSPGPQPPASNMLTMEWDDELADIAQRIADQCFGIKQKFVDDCRLTDRFPYGVMIASIVYNTGVPLDLAHAIKYWYNQVQQFNATKTKKFELSSNALNNTYRLYTQMVWAKSHFIGCGHATFRERLAVKVEGTDEVQHFVYRLVCNYGPAGNVIGEPLYKEGKACSSCPKGYGCSADYAGLCSTKNLVPTVVEDDMISQIEIDFSKNLDLNEEDDDFQMSMYQSTRINFATETTLNAETISAGVGADDNGCKGNEFKQCIIQPRAGSCKVKLYKGIWKCGSCRCDISIRSNSWKLSPHEMFVSFFVSAVMYYIVDILYKK